MSRSWEFQEYTGFSPKEAKLLALIAEGASYQAAGDRLFISINTVRKHIRSIYETLQVHTKSLCPEGAKACSPGLALFASPG